MSEPDPLPTVRTPWGSSPLLPGDAPAEALLVAISDHTLVRRVGRGSYGEVWLARNVLGGYRAVKIVHRQAFDDDRPFERELAGIQRFEPVSRTHESQLNILHVGRTQDCFYYVMELADDMGKGSAIDEGTYTPRTLRSELLLRGRLPVDECLRLGLALTTALAHLHRHGLVHRDIKPSNIVYVNGIPKLADIGLVARAEAAHSFVGTEGYLPPEGPGTVQADLFSLGKVLYEICTGRDRQQFPELPTRVNELPDCAALVELNEVLVRACAPGVKQRYESADEMHLDLALLQSGKSVARMRVVERRIKLAVRAGAAVTAVALLAGAAFFYQQIQTREARRLSGVNRALAEEKTQLAAEQARLLAENRERLVRLDVANGIREMDQGDLAPALDWLTDALTLSTPASPDAAINRIRVNQLLARHPRLLNVLPHPANVPSAEFSPDERRVVTGCMDGVVRIWDLAGDEKPLAAFPQDGPVEQVRYTRDGQLLYVVKSSQPKNPKRVALLDADRGTPVLQATSVTSCMLSPDDRWLAVARTNSVVDLIATGTGLIVAKATGHLDRVETIRFSPDSLQLITGACDGTVRRWEVPTGKAIGSPLRHVQPVLMASFNCDASRIATATYSDDPGAPIRFQVWDAERGTALGRPIQGMGPPSVLSFDLLGRRLLTGDRAGTIQVWHTDSSTPALPSFQMPSHARSIDFSPDGARIAVGSAAGETRVWDAETGSLALPPLHSAGGTESVRFSKDGSRLLTASDDGAVRLWDLAQVPVDRSVRILGHARTTAAVSHDGRHLLLGISDVPPALHLVDLDTLGAVSDPMPVGSYPGLLAFDRNGNQWAVGPGPTRYPDWKLPASNTPCTVDLWRRENGHVRHFAIPHPAWVRGVFLHEDGSQLFTFSDDRMARIWNAVDGSLRQTIRWPEGDVAWIAVSPNFRTAIGVFGNETGWHMRIHEVSTGRILGQSPEKNPDINAATFSPDGSRVGTVGDNQSGRIWDARSGEPITPFFKHGGTLTCLQWSPDGLRVVTAGVSPEVKVWDAATGRLALPPLRMKARQVGLARFSSDGRFIVARSDEDLVRVWDAATGEPLTPLLPHSETVAEVFVTATQRLVTVQNSGGVRVWDLAETAVSTADLLAYVRLLAGGPSVRHDLPGWKGSEELATQLRALRSRQPGLFRPSLDRLREWHRREAQEPTTLARAQTALFHLERLTQLEPANLEIRGALEHCRGLLIPSRDPATPPQILDLTRNYTHSLDLLPRRDFTELPRGRQTLGGTEFDIRGMVKLEHGSWQPDEPGPFRSFAIIQVGRVCRTLHFLQAAEDGPGAEGSTVARWIIHYADGSAREWPVIYGDHVRDWWWWKSAEPLETRQAALAWRGRAPVWKLHDAGGVRLFKATWTNPQPELEIARLEFRIVETALKPFVVAISSE